MKKTPDKDFILQQRDDRLICPSCGELLSRQDVESFAKCPYCDHHFILSGEMEDFLLKQVVDQWYRMNCPQLPGQGNDPAGKHSSWL